MKTKKRKTKVVKTRRASRPKAMLGYHFVGPTLSHGGGDVPPLGVWTRPLPGTIRPCHNGYHASRTAFEAIYYAPYGTERMCLVVVRGITKGCIRSDKFCGRSRMIVASADIRDVADLLLKTRAETFWGQRYAASGRSLDQARSLLRDARHYLNTVADQVFADSIAVMRGLGYK